MSKKLAVLAVCAATGAAFAQNVASIDGAFDAGYQSIDYKGHKVDGFNGNGSTTSQLNIRLTRDLGNGLKAMFRVETDWNTVSNGANQGAKKNDGTLANGSTFGNGEVRGGMSGGFGEVHFGAINNNSLFTFIVGQPYLTAVGSGFGTVVRAQSAGGVRMDNSVVYRTPVLNGFQVTALNTKKQTLATGNDFTATFGAYDKVGGSEVGLNYFGKDFVASLSSHKQDSNGVGTSTKSDTLNTLGGNYLLNSATKLFFIHQTNKASNGTANTSYNSVAATYTMGQHEFSVLSGSLSAKAGAFSGQKSNMTSAGYTYAFDKATDWYVRYENINDKAHVVAPVATIDGTGNTRTRMATGVRINF